jgi:hypothetical protein
VKGIFGANREEVKGEKRNTHNVEYNDLYCSKIYFLVLKSRKRCAVNVENMRSERYVHGFGV